MPPVRLNMAKLAKKDDLFGSREPDSSLTRSQRSTSQPRSKFFGAFKQSTSTVNKVAHNASNMGSNKSAIVGASFANTTVSQS